MTFLLALFYSTLTMFASAFTIPTLGNFVMLAVRIA